jgi:hypothetical protein
MKIDFGGPPTLEISFSDLTNIIIMTKIRELQLRINKLEKSCGGSQKKPNGASKRDKLIQKVGIKSPSPAPKKQKNYLFKRLSTSKKNYYWTQPREEILRDNFHKKGVDKIIEENLLPGFPRDIILKKAKQMGMILEEKKHE